MSAENPSGQSPQGPEQKEWQGQKWEYLVVNLDAWGLIIKHVYGPPPYAPLYESYFKKTSDNQKFGFVLELLGDNGWELAGMYNVKGGFSDDLRLFFKRPGREE